MGISVIGVLFSGCAKDGMAINTMGGNTVDRYFLNGHVVKQQKVIIDDREMAALTGAGVGAVGGAGVGAMAKGGKGATTGGLLGAVAGGIAGAVIGKEVEAYETTIESDGKIYKGYLKEEVATNSVVEFTVVDGKLKNVNVVRASAAKYNIIK